MSRLILNAEIDHGRITVSEPEKLPPTGKALLTVLDASEHKPDWDKVKSLLGSMQNPMDGVTVEREARAEWEAR